MTNRATNLVFLPPKVEPAVGRSRLRLIVRFLLCGIAGGIVGAGGALLIKHVELPWLTSYSATIPARNGGLVVLFCFLMIWPQILLHEAGHALAGISRGMRAISFGVGRWRWERSEDGWRFRRAERLRGVSGFAMLLPQGERGKTRFDQAVYLLGGPSVNLSLAALALVCLPVSGDTVWFTSLLIALAVTGGFIGVINLLPFKTQGWSTDGRNLFDLLSGSSSAEQSRQIRHIMSLTLAGVRPRDWPSSDLPSVVIDPETPPNPIQLSALSLRLSRALDCNDAEAAREFAAQLGPAYASAIEAVRPHVAIGMASFAALIEKDHHLLAAWLPLCEGGLLDLSGSRAWLAAEAAALNGERDVAQEAFNHAWNLRRRVPDAVSVMQLEEYLVALAQRLK